MAPRQAEEGPRRPMGCWGAPPPTSGPPLQGGAASDASGAPGLPLSLRGPIWGLPAHGHVIKGLGDLDGQLRLLLEVLAAATAAAARWAAAQQAARTAAEPAAETAAVLAAASEQGDQVVPGLQRVHPQWQKVPVLEPSGQDARAARLQEIEDHHQEDHENDWHAHAHQHRPAGQREAEHSQRDQEEEEDQVEDGKPAVLGGDNAQALGQADWQAGEGDRVP